MPKLVALQFLRALAALAIALVHLEPDVLARGGGGAAAIRAFPWEAGVDVFFVVSGFVMVYASGPLFGAAGGARRFLARRLARVAPLYWLTTTLVLAVLALRPDLMRSAVATPDLVLASYLFVPWARPNGIVQPVYTLGWTLNYEMFFYAVFALALGLRRRSAVAAVSLTLLGLVAAGLALPSLPQPLAFWTAPILLEFVLGMAIGLARQEGTTFGTAGRTALALAGVALFALAGRDAVTVTGLNQAVLFALPAALLVAACGLAPGRAVGRDSGQDSGQDPGRDPALPPSTWPIRAGEAIGDASYAVYLLHPFAIRGTVRIVDASGLGPALGGAGFAVLALAVTLAVALAVHSWVERPLTRLGRRVLDARR